MKRIMTKNQFRNLKEYKECVSKIHGNPKDYRFTIQYHKMTEGQKMVMHLIANDCVDDGSIRKVAVGIDIHGDVASETYVRL